MDPNVTLNEIRELLSEYAIDDIDISDVADRFNALDAWLSSGGFLPKSWDLAIGSANRFGTGTTQEEIGCPRCAKGEHSFVDPSTGNPVEFCACCGVAQNA